MQTVVSANIVSVLFLGIIVLGVLNRKTVRTKSSQVLAWVCLTCMVSCTVDAACYCFTGPMFPDAFILTIWIITNCSGTIMLIVFTYYCYIFIREQTYINRWFFYVPMIILSLAALYTTYAGITGRIVKVSNGTATIVDGMPFAVIVAHSVVICYLPIIALTKYNQIGRRSVFFLGFFGFIPLTTSIWALLTDSINYSYPAAAMAITVAYVLLENRLTLEREFFQQRKLVDKNKELEKQQTILEEHLNIIQSMSSIYFASYYIDLVNDSYIELTAKDSIRETIKNEGRAQESLNLACEKLIEPEFSGIMREFVDLSTINSRLKYKNVVSCNYIGVTTGWSMACLIAGDRDKNGNLLHIFYAARVIHDEKAKEDKQKKELEEYSNIIANAGLGIWHIYIKNGIPSRMQVNEKMRSLLGIKDRNLSEEEIYNFWYERILPEALPSVKKSVEEIVSGKFSENTYLWHHPEKGNIYVRCGGTSQVLVDGTYVLSGYHSDVTDIVIQEEKYKEDLAKARFEAETANKAKTSFLFNMSHDIRTPMNAIIGFTDLLHKNLDDRKKTEDYISKIQESNMFLLSLVNNVLEMARIESGKMFLEESCWNVFSFNDTIFSVFKESMERKGLTFTRNVKVEHENVFCDSTKVREIFLNLLSNSQKYTPAGGSVTMELTEIPSEKPGYAIFKSVISDTGIGMSKEYLDHIFEEFSRERTSTESKVEGSGLGMSIVKKLVDLMEGTITIESEVNKGTTITIVLSHRIALDYELPEKITTYTDIKNKFKGLKILMAEDNDFNAEIAVEILAEAGFEIERAENGLKCVEMLEEKENGYYALILMDVQMPELNGYEATQRIRSMNNEKASIPIIAMTANAFEEDKKNAKLAGMDGHLSKPIETKLLFNTLSKLLER